MKIQQRVTACVAFVLTALVTVVCAQTDIPKAPEGNLRYTITVTKFNNEAGWRGKWDLGNGFTTAMSDILYQSG